MDGTNYVCTQYDIGYYLLMNQGREHWGAFKIYWRRPIKLEVVQIRMWWRYVFAWLRIWSLNDGLTSAWEHSLQGRLRLSRQRLRTSSLRSVSQSEPGEKSVNWIFERLAVFNSFCRVATMIPRKPTPEPSSKTRLDIINSDYEPTSASWHFRNNLSNTRVHDEVLRKHITRKPCPEASGATFDHSTRFKDCCGMIIFQVYVIWQVLKGLIQAPKTSDIWLCWRGFVKWKALSTDQRLGTGIRVRQAGVATRYGSKKGLRSKHEKS